MSVSSEYGVSHQVLTQRRNKGPADYEPADLHVPLEGTEQEIIAALEQKNKPARPLGPPKFPTRVD